MKAHKITSFIRFNGQGAVECVTWFKLNDGTKTAQIAPYKPSPEQLQQIAQSQYGEITVK